MTIILHDTTIQTPGARLFRAGAREIWIPRTVIERILKLEQPRRDGGPECIKSEVTVLDWFARREGLEHLEK